MAELERVTIDLPEPIADEIRAAVEAGEYTSTSEAVSDAVRVWSGQRHLKDQDIERLRQAWDAGKASGVHGPIDFGELRLEARKRLAEAQAQAGNAG